MATRVKVEDILHWLTRYRRVPREVTTSFKTWKHNSDILPRLQVQLDVIGDAYGKYRSVTYDTQGIHDDGCDVVLRSGDKSDENQDELMGFQVKSYSDLRSKSYMQELKAQHSDSCRKVIGLTHLFILLCTDELSHKNKIRSIEAEFRSDPRTTVIEPSFAYTFLHHPVTRIDAAVQRTFQTEDVVFRKALNTLTWPSPTANALALFLAVQFAIYGKTTFDRTAIVRDPEVERLYEKAREEYENLQKLARDEQENEDWDDEDDDEEDEEDFWFEDDRIKEFQDQYAEDLTFLDEGLIDLKAHSDTFELKPDVLLPISSLALDAVARYEYGEAELLRYLIDLFDVLA